MEQPSILSVFIGEIQSWYESVDKPHLTAALFIFVLVVVIHRPLARIILAGLGLFMKSLNIDTPKEVIPGLVRPVGVTLIALTFLNIALSLGLNAVTDGTVFNLVYSIMLVAFFSACYRLAEAALTLAISGSEETSLEGHRWLLGLARILIVVCGVVAILAVWGIDINGAVTGVGVLGAGLAIAAQDFIKNLVAGVSNTKEKRFDVGDRIAIPGQLDGIVESVGIRSTRVVGLDRVPVNVPNAVLANSLVQNYSDRDHWRIVWDVPILRSATIDQVNAVASRLSEYVDSCGDYVTDGSLFQLVHVVGMEESAIQIRIHVFCKTKSYPEVLAVRERLTTEILAAANAAGTELAYPTQRVVFSQMEQV